MRAIAWTRVSTGRQDDGVRQLDQIRKYCIVKGYELIEAKTIPEVISGKADERTGLADVIELTKADADIVIVSESSRATRKSEDDYLDLYNVVRAIQKTGLDLYFLGSSQSYSADKKLTLIDVITLVIEADRNAKELELLKFRTKSGKQSKVDRGGYIGGNMPYGYRSNGQKTDSFSIIEDESVVVRLIFDLVGTHGYSVNNTALHLARTQNFVRDGRGILNILRNPVYKGEFTILGVLQNVPAIITSEQFEEVQLKISLNHKFINKGNKHYNQLKGLAKCACGYSMLVSNVGHSGGVERFGYKCSSKGTARTHVPACANGGVNVDLLNNIVWKITRAYINADDFKVKTDKQREIIKVEIKAIDKRVLKLQAETIENQNKIESLTDTIIEADKYSKPVLLKRLSEMVITSEKIEKETGKANIEGVKLRNRLKDLSVALLPSQIESLSDEGKHEIFVKYIQTVTYYSINMNKGFVVISFKNGAESIVMTSTRPVKEAFQLPDTFKFNAENRIIIDATQQVQPEEAQQNQLIDILPTIHSELTYSEMFKRYNMEEFNMSNEISNEEIERNEKYNNEYSDKLKELDKAISAEMNL